MDKQVADLMKDQVNRNFIRPIFTWIFPTITMKRTWTASATGSCFRPKKNRQHALKILKYLQDNNEKVKLETIPAPEFNFTNLRESPGRHPQARTVCYRPYSRHFQKARESDDFRSYQFMEWFGGRTGRRKKRTPAT